MAFNLDDFKKINLAPGSPSISVTSNGITFNKAAIVKLDEAEKVNLFINENEKALAVATCTDDDKSLNFLKKGKKAMSVRWNNKDLLQRLEDLMGWSLSDTGYRIQGCFDREQNALFFDLKSATNLDANKKESDMD
ncbi:hypothetical protein SDC9_45910 [bioreactor metagenome]|uniref:Uncharacterized protein n=1 Tax=bioreactor metagenome TaxID=1076179 RepID=A0A644W896_9ZZZZ